MGIKKKRLIRGPRRARAELYKRAGKIPAKLPKT